LIGHAEECGVDSGGRILLPAPLREFAGLDKRVVLVGQGNKFEVWNEAGVVRTGGMRCCPAMDRTMANPCPIWIRWRSE
jgi:hypothetical protein